MSKPTDDKRLTEQPEVIVEPESTLIGHFQKVRTNAITDMFNNVGACGIYPTTKFFVDIDDEVRRIERTAREDGFKAGLKAASEHGWEWGGDASGVFWCKCRKWNEDMVPTWEQHIAEIPVTEIASRRSEKP